MIGPIFAITYSKILMEKMKSILIIENERSIRHALRLSFERLGYKVYCTESFSEARYLTKSLTIDLIIMDDEIYKTTKFSELSIIDTVFLILTNCHNGYYETIETAQIQIIKKPFSLKLIRKKVSTIFRIKQSRKNKCSQNNQDK